MRLIEINLKKEKQRIVLPSFMGVELSVIQFKLVFVSLLMYFFIPPFFNDYLAQKIVAIQQELEQVLGQHRQVMSQSQNIIGIKTQIEEYSKKEKILEAKLQYVKQIIDIKKNPHTLLLFIAKNIPSDLWLTQLIIKNDDILLEGYSKSYKSINTFIDSLSESIFFKVRPNMEESETKTDPGDNKRKEFFKIKSTISRYTL